MMEFHVEWKPTDNRYTSRETCYLGKWPVARVYYDGISSRTYEERYKIEMLLPGYKSFIELRFLKIEDAKLQAVKFISNWLDKAGLSNKDEE